MRDPWQLIVVEEDDPPGAHQSREVHEINKYSIEKVVAIDECEVKLSTFADEPRECKLRLIGMELNEPGYPGLVEKLKPTITKPR